MYPNYAALMIVRTKYRMEDGLWRGEMIAQRVDTAAAAAAAYLWFDSLDLIFVSRSAKAHARKYVHKHTSKQMKKEARSRLLSCCAPGLHIILLG